MKKQTESMRVARIVRQTAQALGFGVVTIIHAKRKHDKRLRVWVRQQAGCADFVTLVEVLKGVIPERDPRYHTTGPRHNYIDTTVPL